MEIRTKAVVFYEEGVRSAKEIGEMYNISERTVRRWSQHHRDDPENGLQPKKTGPKRSRRAIPASLEQRIIRLKGKYPAWGARRIKHQFNLPCSWRTVHRVLKKQRLLIRIKAKPQPAGKRFQRHHVDSNTLQWALRKGRIPREIYLDNGKQFVSEKIQSGSENTRHQTDIRQTLPLSRPRKN